MITKEMIVKGYEQGILQLRESPNGDGYTWCEIEGKFEFAFNFGGTRADGEALKKFSPDMPVEDIANELCKVFEEIREESIQYNDAYDAYEEILKKNLDPLGYLREQAELFVRENPELAREIYRVIDREKHREGIVGEMADVTGKAVRDGNKYYLLEDLDRHMSLEEQIAGAEKQKTDPDGKAVERKLDL